MKARILFALLASSLVGCGARETVVSGTVTVNNQPLRSGYITFFPVEGTKGVKGAPVSDGQYTLRKMSPGKWKALISETPDVRVLKNGNDAPTLSISPSRLAISPQTKGNQPIVDIRVGKQSLDIALQNP